MKQLFCDCKTDEEKSNFFLSGRAVESGVIAPALVNDVAMAYHRCAEFKKETDALRARIAEMEKQAPVAWHTFDGEGGYDYRSYAMKKDQMGSLISRLQRPGYDLQKEQAIQETIVMLRQCNAQSKPDCGEAGHDEGRCGNVQCLPGAQTKGERNE